MRDFAQNLEVLSKACGTCGDESAVRKLIYDEIIAYPSCLAKTDNAGNLIAYLEINNIPYKRGEVISTIDIFDSDPNWPKINTIATSLGIPVFSETSFSKQELLSAQWLRVRSKWHNGYPLPEGAFAYRNITYAPDSYCVECGCGLRQVAPFRMKGAPKWGTRHFMSLNWITDELFVDDLAKNILTQEGLTGFHFMPTHNRQGIVELPDIHQLVIEEVTVSGFIEGREDLRETLVCPICGCKKQHPNGIGMHAFRKEIFEGMPDICKCGDYFGWGKAGDRLILVRQEFYRAIIENHLERCLVFEPIELI